MNRENLLIILKKIWIAAAVIGFIGLIIRFATGEKFANYGSYITWGLWVAIYFHGIGIAGGVYLIGIVGYFLKWPVFKDSLRTTLIISFSALVMGFFTIWIDLGHPLRIFGFLISPQFKSMMAFNAWAYGLFLVILVASFVLTYRKKSESDTNDRSGWLVPLLLTGIPFVIAIPSQSGAFFGVVNAKSFWNSAIMPVLFFLSAVASGAAVLALAHNLLSADEKQSNNPKSEYYTLLKKFIAAAVILYLFFEIAEFSLPLWSGTSHIAEEVKFILFGPFWWLFWLVHVGGAVAGIFFLFRSNSAQDIGIGAFLIAVTFLASRLNIIVPGQAISDINGLREAFSDEKLALTYLPSVFEWMVALFSGCMITGLIYFGEKYRKEYHTKLTEIFNKGGK